jgi:hypothetical protein
MSPQDAGQSTRYGELLAVPGIDWVRPHPSKGITFDCHCNFSQYRTNYPQFISSYDTNLWI